MARNHEAANAAARKRGEAVHKVLGIVNVIVNVSITPKSGPSLVGPRHPLISVPHGDHHGHVGSVRGNGVIGDSYWSRRSAKGSEPADLDRECTRVVGILARN